MGVRIRKGQPATLHFDLQTVVFELKQLCVVASDLRTRYEGSSYQVQCCAWGLNRCKERGMGRSEKENLAEEL